MDTQDWRRLQDLADRLERAWGGAEEVDLGQLLPPPGDPLRAAVLLELITTDLAIRCRRKRGRPLECYVALFSELGTTAAVPPELIYEGYRARCRHGDRPELAVYRERFPGRFADFQKLLERDLVRLLARRARLSSVRAGAPACSACVRGSHVTSACMHRNV